MDKKNTVFGRQLLNRKERDSRMMNESLLDVADSLRGQSRYHYHEYDSVKFEHELRQICAYFKINIPDDIPASNDINDTIEFICRPIGMMHRRVMLDGNWWKDGDGPVLAVFKDTGMPIALIPGPLAFYYFKDSNGNRIRVNKKNKDIFEREAVCFYAPLPQHEISGRELVLILLRSINRVDIVRLIVSTLTVTTVGMIVPFATNIIFSKIIPTGLLLLVYSIFILLLAVSISSYIISIARTALLGRIRQRMEVFMENAIMGRLISLPAKFFQEYSSGGLSQSVLSLNYLPTIITDAVLGPAMTTLFSIVYLVQISLFAPSLSIPAFAIFIAEGLLLYISIKQKIKLVQAELEGDIATHGMVFPIITGIQRIRLSGSEERVMARWAEVYKKKAGPAFKIVFPATFQNELITALTLLGTLFVYKYGASSGIAVSQFAAFQAAFGVVTAALMQFSASGIMVAYLKPTLKMIDPVIKCIPEVNGTKEMVSRLRGGIELNGVSFRYTDEQPLILNDISLKIKPGEYVAIVGRSGCGKSTIIRLLMGFEKPLSGTISYDDIPIDNIDPRSLRSNIGTVLQNGKLFVGDIFSNITISAPYLTLKDAWEAAEKAGVADTIRQMPMQMNTLISEGSGGISGGQKQRLLIARAIAPKPKILILDEATSALDNITQKMVSDSLDALNCTRIVVAHRLSTIKNCDRIIVLDKGKIIEDGTYDDLIARKGFFCDLVSRQQLD